jgi:hypothetical protein
MVHALEEGCRVLVPRGLLVDLRPLSLDAPLEIVYPDEALLAGHLDMSLDRDGTIAADQALEAVIAQVAFETKRKETFDFAYYWDSLDEAAAYVEDNWEDWARLPEPVLWRAKNLVATRSVKGRIRIRERLQLTVLAKP